MSIFASRTPRDLNHDPNSWLWEDGCRLGASKETHRHNDKAWYDPRPEFDHVQHNEPNPILVAIRGSSVSPVEWHVAVFSTEIYGGHRTWDAPEHPFHVLTLASDEQLDHADRVLDRLVRAREASDER